MNSEDVILVTGIVLTLGVALLVILLLVCGLFSVGIRSRRQSRTERVLRDAALDLARAADAEAVDKAANRALTRLALALFPHASRLPAPRRPEVVNALLSRSVPTGTDGHTYPDPLGADAIATAPGRLRLPLEMLSVQVASARERLRLNDEITRRDRERYLDAVVEHATDVVLIVDNDDKISYASPSARTMFGTSVLHDVALPDLVDRDERRSAEFLLRHARAGGDGTGTGCVRADWTVTARDGRKVLAEVSCRDLRAEDAVRGVVITLRDVTGQRHLEHELTRNLFHDALTGLPNRALFGERVSQAIASDGRLVGVLLIDLDNFKAVNDGLGHDVGDAVLKTTGRLISEALGSRGLAARLGDDEFAALISTLGSTTEADEVAADITARLSAPLRVGDALISAGASVGVATTDGDGTTQELLRWADLALQTAKSAGYGHWCHYEPSMTDTMMYRLELRSALGRALHDDSLRVEYQPIVALDTGRTAGFEALIRWQHPTLGLLPPKDFIDIAEESGLITPIGEWVLGTALAAAARWPAVVPGGPPYVSVNVSAQQFHSSGYVDSVRQQLRAAGVPPDRLVLEITESLLLRDDDKVWEDLQILRQDGVRIAIDDFGTGYSALGYLRQAPLDIVKLDRLFISTLTTSARQRELVEGIVRLTRTLNLRVVAEGIETDLQRKISTAIGCAYGQGYLYSRSMPETDAYRWLMRERQAPGAGRAPTGSAARRE